MRYLGELLRAPGREVHVLELMRVASPGVPQQVEPGFDGAGGQAEEAILDARAKREFRQRLSELEEDLDESASRHDIERASRIKVEIDAITYELASAAGLGGRDRRMPSPAERARVSVTKAIRGAVRAIAADCPQLGFHLEASVRTGRLCCYAPPGEAAPDWQR
jgi:non-specific serine/threonine protein kinase